jgi:hypothetical protein
MANGSARVRLQEHLLCVSWCSMNTPSTALALQGSLLWWISMTLSGFWGSLKLLSASVSQFTGTGVVHAASREAEFNGLQRKDLNRGPTHLVTRKRQSLLSFDVLTLPCSASWLPSNGLFPQGGQPNPAVVGKYLNSTHPPRSLSPHTMASLHRQIGATHSLQSLDAAL